MVLSSWRRRSLREALDPAKVQEALASSKNPKDVLFDLALANELYSELLGPIENTIKDKKHLLVVPTGALTCLPFNVLVTAKPETGATKLSDYRDVAWLAKKQAITVLPSVASLRALRVLAKAGAGAKPLTGYANPVFNQGGSQAGGQTRVASTRAYFAYYRGTQADLDALRNGYRSSRRRQMSFAPLPSALARPKAKFILARKQPRPPSNKLTSMTTASSTSRHTAWSQATSRASPSQRWP